MSLTVNGIIIVDTIPIEQKVDKGYFFSFTSVSRERPGRKHKVSQHSTSMFIFNTDIEQARKSITQHTILYIHDGEWVGDNKLILNYNKVNILNIKEGEENGKEI